MVERQVTELHHLLLKTKSSGAPRLVHKYRLLTQEDS
jgi:hypothetical protein